ncbi:cyclopropane-fatty-acyl-phospholipid synthase [Anaerocolumna cellulosilytica]|uniref:Cyclopropane-fatty-acyl-phospholipid synthase n=1 Tax=Anaerocolumna cellulosilytica TaxID=433286 RepID=A0A6S6R3H1_9FIRM|nr:cyclopropane-fatty-acyl-phospholipid synthase family protein [Anaerocolumna cellulosilytica]MBB5195366.1 cyclopropane-fatty-acyl-phospholipid synthase [Anaerocolumna cellulosilytica]BCJ95899.1 cyclopropane-fatty-acyl-phospholipid synthase [Anaerocolumna cellulosilytica]
MFDNFFIEYLSNIIPVAFNLQIEDETRKVGNGEAEFTIMIKKPISKTELLTSTSLALGEAYMRGEIDVDKDLYEVLNLFLGEMGKFTTNKSKLKSLLFTATSKANQKKEVSSHYDIGNEFYRLWLDETMSYSCGYFKEEKNTLYEAQMNKIHHILDKLHLEEGMTLLDIGCGWGALLIEAAKKYGIKGTGITLSQEQHAKFKERIQEEGLTQLLDVRIMDYRDLIKSELTFDRIVSVGMLEHVGRKNYDLFIKNADAVLKEKGLFLLHSITALKEHPGDAWIKKYIFPGGTVPSLREILQLMPEYRFYILDVESLRRHYNRTLLCWRSRFVEHREEIVTLMGEEFTRMWELYLASCAATFNNGIIDLHQILLSKGANNELPMIRVV